jgi:Undecaprenyl-phosphate galactose phosphotransferase WbaP
MYEIDAGKLPIITSGKNDAHAKPLSNNSYKKVIDIIGCSLILFILAPLMLAIAFFVKSDGGPALFRHKRIGANGKAFYCLKFRTMHLNSSALLEELLKHDTEAREEWERNFKLRNDPRITKIGAFLRKSSLDELPQLINVLRGEMSLVGPRPIVEAEVPRYRESFEHYKQCRPGLTGLWQVSGRSDVDYDRRVKMDRMYVESWSLLEDVKILLRTPLAVVRSSGAY